MAKAKRKHVEPPAINYEIVEKVRVLADLTPAERTEVVECGRRNQKKVASQEQIELSTGRNVEIFGTSKVRLL